MQNDRSLYLQVVMNKNVINVCSEQKLDFFNPGGPQHTHKHVRFY